MAKTKKKTTSRRLHPQAMTLFANIRYEYADATDQQWDELREHLDAQFDIITGGSPEQMASIVREFERVRSLAVRSRDLRGVLAALKDGKAELTRQRPDGLQEWSVTSEGGLTVTMTLPDFNDEVETEDVEAARVALLSGKCPSCGRTPEIVGQTLDVTHAPRCRANRAFD